MLLLFLTLYFVHLSLSYGQDKFLKLGSCKGYCFSETISEFVLTAKGLDETHDIFIRLCTKDKFEVALSKANFNIEHLKYWFQYHQMNILEVPVFLSKQCASKSEKNILLQILASKKDSKVIPFLFDEKLNFADFSITRIEGESDKSKVTNFIQLLAKSPNSFGTIFGLYNYYPSAKLTEQILKVRLLLRKNKVSPKRYLIQTLTTGFKNEPPDPEKNYLNFQIIEINRTTSKPIDFSKSKKNH